MRDWFERLFSPSEEPSYLRDPYVFGKAASEAERRRQKYERLRRRLFRKVRAKAVRSKLPKGVLVPAQWQRHEEEKIG
jgi:hypothetical protein